LPKEAVFSLHKDEPRFARFSNKTVHILLAAPAPGTPPFEYEAEHRREMTRQLNAHGAMPGTLVLMADVDEIPSAHTVQLLRSCSGWGPRLHLGLRNFLYSFEWELVDISWRAAVEEWGPNSWYGHSKHEGTTYALADSGWHCRCVQFTFTPSAISQDIANSFCFRTIKEFVTKMTGVFLLLILMVICSHMKPRFFSCG
jgi:beta-1,4-mannosyl-glycoprotein beta-1,4-N-acetylglucosaminyltransferase